MTDQFDPTLGDETSNTAAPVPGNDMNTSEPEMPEDTGDENFLEDNHIDPATIVTILTSGAEPRYIPVNEPAALRDLVVRANLTYSGQVDAYVDGNSISFETLVSGGQTVTLIGNVKGGSVA
jgi:hypothetical protein